MNRVEVSRWADFRDQVLKLHVIESIKVVGADARSIIDPQGPGLRNIRYEVDFDNIDSETGNPRYYEVPFGDATQTIAGFGTESSSFRDHVPLNSELAERNYHIPENFDISTAPIHMNIKRQDGISRRIVFETNENPEGFRFVRDEGLIVLDLRRHNNPVDDGDEILSKLVNHPKLRENVQEYVDRHSGNLPWTIDALYCYVKFKNPLEDVMVELGQLLAREHMRPMLPPEAIAQVTKYARNKLRF